MACRVYGKYALEASDVFDMPEINGDGDLVDDESQDDGPQDGETVDDDTGEIIEGNRKPQEKPKPETKPAPKPEPENDDGEDDDSDTGAPPMAQMRACAHGIIQDIKDAPALLDDLLDHHKITIDQIEANYPDLYKELMDQVLELRE